MMQMISTEIICKALKTFYNFGCVVVYALAAIGGVTYLFVDGHGVFGFAGIAVTAMATPYLIERIKELMQS